MTLRVTIQGPVTFWEKGTEFPGFTVDLSAGSSHASYMLRATDLDAVLDDLPAICRGFLNTTKPKPC